MLANKSIRYLRSRQEIKYNREAVTVRDLRDCLNVIIAGGCGDFEVRDLSAGAITHYTLSDRRRTLKLE